MVDLNRLPEGSSEGSIPDSNTPMTEILDSHDESVVGDPATHDYQLNHDSDNDQEDNEPEVVAQGEEDDEEEEDEVEEQGVNYFQWTQPAYAQPEITRHLRSSLANERDEEVERSGGSDIVAPTLEKVVCDREEESEKDSVGELESEWEGVRREGGRSSVGS
ncbi:hypothetical protein PIB30_030298 [Stylosanthes scabra]|uniref:Uncharacterized protein n=1 Tax=Stylosanthes scabra TaxID=79078 RepID=A0ABU6QBF4_9FABA|nr:hypothetical protein [Stylosanthes scabra]